MNFARWENFRVLNVSTAELHIQTNLYGFPHKHKSKEQQYQGIAWLSVNNSTDIFSGEPKSKVAFPNHSFEIRKGKVSLSITR